MFQCSVPIDHAEVGKDCAPDEHGHDPIRTWLPAARAVGDATVDEFHNRDNVVLSVDRLRGQRNLSFHHYNAGSGQLRIRGEFHFEYASAPHQDSLLDTKRAIWA